MAFNFKQVADEQKEKAPKAIFNGGNAGVVLCSVSVETKKPTDHVNAPDYKIILTDENGGQINEGFYNIAEADQGTEDAPSGRLKFARQKLFHLTNGIFAGKFEAKESYPSYEACLKDVMLQVFKEAKNKKYRVIVNYGNIGKDGKDYSSQYLQTRGFGHYIEREDMPLTLQPQKNELQERIVMDKDVVKDVTKEISKEDDDSLPF